MCRATSEASNTSCAPVPDRPSHSTDSASSAIDVGRIIRVRYSLPRHKRGEWVGPGRKRKSSRPSENGVVDLSPFEFLDRLADLIPPPRKHRHRYHGAFAPNHPLRPAVTTLAIGNAAQPDAEPGLLPCSERPRRTRQWPLRHRRPTLPRHLSDCLGETAVPESPRSFRSSAHAAAATSGSSPSDFFQSVKQSLAFALLATSGCCGLPVRDPSADSQDTHARSRAARAAASFSSPWAAHRLTTTGTSSRSKDSRDNMSVKADVYKLGRIS